MISKAKVYRLPLRKNSQLRIDKLAIALIILITVFSWMTAPTLNLLKERANNNRLRKQLEKQIATNKAVKENIEELKTKSYIELKARQGLGLVKPNEIQYYVLTKKTKQKVKVKPIERKWYSKVLDFIEITFTK